MDEFEFLKQYFPILPFFFAGIVLVFLITPFIAKLSAWLEIFDLPASMRRRTDSTKDQRLHHDAKLKLGGVGTMAVFIILTILSGAANGSIIGILIGSGILIVAGFLDDKYELPPWAQLAFNFAAAFCAVTGGITIRGIDILDITLNFDISTIPLQIGPLVHTYIFPADFITIFWIVGMINAVNWMCGIDALGESISIIAAITIGLIAMRIGYPQITMVAFILAGCVLGFVPYNFPPSKIFSGSAGDYNFGFLLATLSIFDRDSNDGAKLAITIMLLIIPIVDMIYVLINRFITYKVFNPLKLLSISGRIHLHHRIIDMGFTMKQTLYFEITFFLIFALITYYISGFRFDLLIVFAIMVAVLVIFAIIAFINKGIQKKKEAAKKVPQAKIIEAVAPEERYKY